MQMPVSGPEVSVVIPTYNSEQFIRETIDSVFNQSYQDFEVIVVDDASSDKTAQIVREFDSRLKYIRHSSNMGSSAARNTGIKYAKGKYVAFLDADDIWIPSKIQEQIKLLESNKDIALAYSNGYSLDFSGLEIGTLFDIVRPHRGFVFEELLIDNFIPTSSVVVKKQILNEVGGFNERFLISQDFDLYLRIAEGHKIDFVDYPLFKYRAHPDSLSSKKRKLMLEEAISITKFYRDKVGFNNLRFGRKLDKRIAKHLFYIAIWSLEHTNRREALRCYWDCIKAGAFDYKILLGSVFFITPRFISAPLVRNLIKTQYR